MYTICLYIYMYTGSRSVFLIFLFSSFSHSFPRFLSLAHSSLSTQMSLQPQPNFKVGSGISRTVIRLQSYMRLVIGTSS